MNKKIRGFTLFELLVSISIIGILTALGVVSFSSAQVKARDARRMEDMTAIQKAAEQYYSLSNGSYPTTTTGAWTFDSKTVLEVFPADPKGGASYTYSCTQTTSSYCCCATLEAKKGNSSSNACVFVNTNDGDYYCVKNQQ